MKIQKLINLILMILLYLSTLGIFLFYEKNPILIIGLLILIVWLISNFIWMTFFKTIQRNLFFYILNFALLYVLLNAGAFSYDKYLSYKLNQFDINKDSVFSKEEQTPEQNRYMDMLANDLDRNLMFITGGFISMISTFFLLLVVVFFNFVRRHFWNTE